jgi:hypothetical protein
MKKWVVSYIIAFALPLSPCPGQESIRGVRTVDTILLEKKVPIGYGKVFVQAGRQNNLDPVVLAAISAHESAGWKSRIARQKNNWMGLMTPKGAKSSEPRKSRFFTQRNS